MALPMMADPGRCLMPFIAWPCARITVMGRRSGVLAGGGIAWPCARITVLSVSFSEAWGVLQMAPLTGTCC